MLGSAASETVQKTSICPDFDGLSLLNRRQPNKHADFGRKIVL